jgi:plasmid stability protein
VSLELKPVQVRLPEEAYEALKMIAEANNHDLGEEAREILIEALMGKGHALIMTFERLKRAVRSDNVRQRASTAEILRQRSEQDE